MPAARPVSRGAFLVAAVGLAAGAFVVGRLSGARDAEQRLRERDGDLVAAPPSPAAPHLSVAPIAPPPPAHTSSRSVRVRDGGSIFHAQVTHSEALPTGTEGMLLTDRDNECVDGCPLGLRVVGAPAGPARRDRIFASLEPYLDDLEDATGSHPGFVETLRRVREALSAPPPVVADARARRALVMGVPRPELGDATAEICLALYNHADPHFDGKRLDRCPAGGSHLLVVRLERRAPGDERLDLVGGVVEVEERAADGAGVARTPATEAAPVVVTLGLVYGHFSGPRGRVHGLFLDESGAVFSYDETLAPRPLPSDTALVSALSALLRRA